VEPATIGYIALVVLFILLFSGMPIGLVMAVIGLVGMAFVTGWGSGAGILGTIPYQTWSSYDLSVTPLFILMGTICFYAGISHDLYRTVHTWLGHLPGGLAMATVGACASFSAVSGSSLATAATMGTVALPEMKRYKYDDRLATGSVAAGGTIGILIPPSVILILYGVLTGQSIGKLFAAGFIPGVLEAVFYIFTIYILCKRNPLMGPRGSRANFKERMVSLKGAWGALVLFLLVIGGIYFGVFTPTEAGAIGAFGALVIVFITRQLTRKVFLDILKEAGSTSAMIFFIVIGAFIFMKFLGLSKLPFAIVEIIEQLQVSKYVVFGGIILLYIVLGMFLEVYSAVTFTIPIIYPVILALGFDPIWFGVIIVLVIEMGLITPPVGMNVFILSGMTDIPLHVIFRGVLPFVIAMIFCVIILVIFPEIALLLPRLM